MTWQPARGERVLAVLPDGHEIEGWYQSDLDDRHCVLLDDNAIPEVVFVRTVKPLPVTEPTAFGARVIDADGVRWVRIDRVCGETRNPWTDGNAQLAWSELPQPVTIIDADPDWGQP